MSATSRTAVGGLMFQTHESWSLGFEPGRGDTIVGRRMYEEVGLLCIRYRARDLLAGPITHSSCLAVACSMLGVPSGPGDSGSKDGSAACSISVEQVEIHDAPDGPYGAATFVGPRETRRVFYCNRPPGLIVGVYSCPSEFADDSARSKARREAQHLVWTAVFDRPAWGGDDPLTRALLNDE